MKTKLKQTSKKKYTFVILALFVILLMTFVPIPYYLEVPGTAERLNTIVKVNGKDDPYKGAFYVTTVGIRQATLLQALMAPFTPFTDGYTKDEIFGKSSSQEYDTIQDYYMKTSQHLAKKVALELAHKKTSLTFKGVYVLEVTKDSQFKGKIKPGDIVTKLNGNAFSTSQEFIEDVKEKHVGEEISVTFLRKGKEQQAKGKLIRLKKDKKAGIGISLVDHTELTTPDTTIEMNLKDVGGPSGGLMFTLETYGLLTQKDLRKGHYIAGTGTIDEKGNVGRIGGIDKKVVAASNQGADLFFAPDDPLTKEELKHAPHEKSNFKEAKETAKKIKTKMKIVPVKTAQEALEYLNQLNDKK